MAAPYGCDVSSTGCQEGPYYPRGLFCPTVLYFACSKCRQSLRRHFCFPSLLTFMKSFFPGTTVQLSTLVINAMALCFCAMYFTCVGLFALRRSRFAIYLLSRFQCFNRSRTYLALFVCWQPISKAGLLEWSRSSCWVAILARPVPSL